MEQGTSREDVKALVEALPEVGLPVAASVLRTIGRRGWDRASFEAVVGFQPAAIENDTAAVRLEVAPHLLNPNGILHGGVLFAVMDSSMGSILMSSVAEGETCATVESKINFLASVREGVVTVETRVVHRGSRIAVLESRATTDSGRLAAVMTGTFMFLR
jgi:acyl-CoA thioesterase